MWGGGWLSRVPTASTQHLQLSQMVRRLRFVLLVLITTSHLHYKVDNEVNNKFILLKTAKFYINLTTGIISAVSQVLASKENRTGI